MSRYLDMLKNLLPSGKAWNRMADSLITLLDVRADGYQAVDDRAVALIDEAIPDTTQEMLPEWEGVCGLPDPLLAGEEQTEAQRRNAVLAKLIASGSLSIQFLEAIATNYGYDITIEEYATTYNSLCGNALCGQARCGASSVWKFVFNVLSDGDFVVFARCGTALCGDRIAVYDNVGLQVLMARHKPAHTIAVYNYGE